VDYVFATNNTRYRQMSDALLEEEHKNVKLIATSNIEPRGKKFDFVIDRAPLLDKKDRISDNSFLMLLSILWKIGAKDVACAGLDGYSEKEDNYFNPKMEYGFIKAEARHLNHHIRDTIAERYADMNIEFVTYSHYTEIEDCYDAGF
jgi:4-hydroxy 2-oxovalerate aldolase